MFAGRIVTGSLISAYPLIVFWPVLARDRLSRLGSAATDMNGTLFEIQSLQFMKFPWSKTFRSSFPDGDFYWTIGRLVHAAVLVPAWFVVRVLSPVETLNLFILIGWILTGFATFQLARSLDVGRRWAVFAAVLAEMLPWFPSKATDHFFYVWMGVPIFVLARAIRFAQSTSQRDLLTLIAALGLTFMIDTYLFALAALGLIIILAEALSRKEWRLQIRSRCLPRLRTFRFWAVIGLIAVGLILSVNVAFAKFNEQNMKLGNPARGVATDEEILRWTGSIADLFTPHAGHWLFAGPLTNPQDTDFVMYGTMCAPLIVFFGLVFRQFRRSLRPQFLVLILGAFFILLAMNPISVGGFQISLSQILRYVLPGIRVFARSAVLGQILILILAIWLIERSVARLNSKSISHLTTIALLLVLILDASPAVSLPPSSYIQRYKVFEELITAARGSHGTLIPDGKLEPIEISMETLPDALDVPLLNNQRGSWRPHAVMHAALGKTDFANYLLSRSIHFIVARSSGDGRPVFRGHIQDLARVNLVLDGPEFIEVSRLVTDDGQLVHLLKVATPASQWCKECVPAQFYVTPQVDMMGASGGALIDDIYWSQESQLRLVGEPLGTDEASNNIVIRFEIITFDDSLQFRVIDDLGVQIQPSRTQWGTSWYNVELKPKEAVTITADKECQVKPVPGKEYCWGLGQFVAYQQP